ncbi:hypothetical protein evm_012213 [Chilo suppressalis]|nr:hypothetical protein evm_012213 [Chilo suppressalis]
MTMTDTMLVVSVGSTTTFLTGHKYNYGVEGTVSIYLTGADKQETSVKLLGQVTVTSIGNCVNELKVQNLVISGPDGKKYSSPPGIDKPVLFTLQDGRTGSEICAEEQDTRRSLNIKRAIISLLQTEQKSSTQPSVQSLPGGRRDERPCAAGVQRRCKTKDFSNGKPEDNSRGLQQHSGTAELSGGAGMAELTPIPTQNRHWVSSCGNSPPYY